jgi:hypothetical protein
MLLKPYNPSQIIAVLVGVPIVGIADGTFLKIAYATDAITHKTGEGGDVVRMVSQDRTALITVTLLASSPSNAALQAMADADRPRDRSKPAGLGVAPSTVKDLNGSVLAQAANSWIVKVPDVEFGKESANREWSIATDDLAMFHGGI